MEQTTTRVCKCCGQEKDLKEFKATRWGTFAYVCNECANKKRNETRARNKEQRAADISDELTNARATRLAEFTPRELMQELARRGYSGKLEYTQTYEIDIQNL